MSARTNLPGDDSFAATKAPSTILMFIVGSTTTTTFWPSPQGPKQAVAFTSTVEVVSRFMLWTHPYRLES
jgi:hypothetical protein